MNKREKTILAITIVVIIVGVIFKFLPENFATAAFGGGDVEGARESLNGHIEQMSYGFSIRNAFDEVNTKLPETIPGRTPELTFSDEVSRMLNERNWQTPTIKPYKTEKIKDVPSYYYINLEVTVTGEYGRIVNLLVDFQEKNILIKEFKVEKNNMDVDQVTLNVKLSRLAKVSEEEQKRLARRTKSAASGS